MGIAENGEMNLAGSEDRAGDPALLNRKSVLMGLTASVGFMFANAAQPPAAVAGTVKPIASSQPPYAPKWLPNTAYALGQQVISPNNDVVSARVTHKSSAAFATDASKWNLSCTYVPAVVTEGAGIDPTGATVSTGLQTVFDRAILTDPMSFRMPKGIFKLTAALDFPFAPNSRVSGAGKDLTILRQTTPGQSVIKFTHDLTHSINLEDLTLEYDSPQTDPHSVGILYDGPPTMMGFFNHYYRDLNIRNTYRGIAVSDSTGPQTAWNLWCENLHFFQTKNCAVFMLPRGSVGVPQVVFRGIQVDNTGGLVVSTGPAFYINGVELTVDNLDIEGWHNEILSSGSGNISIRGLHVEHHRFSNSFSRLFYVANGALTVDGFSVSGATTTGCTDMASLVNPGVNSNVTLVNGDHNVDCELGGSYLREVMYSSGEVDVSSTVTNVTKSGGGLNQAGEGNPQARHALTGFGRLPNGLRGVQLGSGVITFGSGSPEGVVAARTGSLYLRDDGGRGSTFYVKELGTGNTGWVTK